MIKTLELHNFESHRNSTFEFVPGVNIIVGATDAGKTAVMRALKKITKNRPSGDDFCSWEGVNDGTGTSIKVTTDTDSITWKKAKQDQYILNGMKPFEAFRTDVPEEIAQALNMNEINLKTQFESHYLLSDSPGEVAQHFNKVARLDKIDKGLSNVNSWIRDINADVKHTEQEINSLTESIKKFNYLDELESAVQTLEMQESDLTAKRVDLKQLQDLLNTIIRIEKEIEITVKKLELKPLLDQVLIDWEKLDELKSDLSTLKRIVNQVKSIDEDLEKQNQILAIKELTDQLLSYYNEKKELEEERQALISLNTRIQSTQTKLEEVSQLYDDLHETYEREFPDECPLCGSPKKK